MVDVHGCSSMAPKLAAHASAAALSSTEYTSVSPGSASSLRHDREPVGGVGRTRLVPEPGLVDPVGVAVQVDRAVGEVGEDRRGHRGVVPDQVAFGDRLVRSLGGDQHLVEVGELHRVVADLPLPAAGGKRVERRQLVGVGRVPQRVARPGRRRRSLHLVVGPPGLDRPRMILGVPPVHGVLVALVEQHPLLTGTGRAAANEGEVAVQLLAEQVEVQVAGLDGCDRVVGVGQLPRAPVPHDHVAAAVLAGGDHALEVEVPERVILDVDGHPLRRRVERRALRHRPAEQHAGSLEPQVVVEPSRPVALHHEPVARLQSAGRDGRSSPDGSGVTEKSRLRRYVVRRSPAAGDRRFDVDRFPVVLCFIDFDVPVGVGDVDVGVRFLPVFAVRVDASVAMPLATPMARVENPPYHAASVRCRIRRNDGAADLTPSL